jgi:hypothetical protein
VVCERVSVPEGQHGGSRGIYPPVAEAKKIITSLRDVVKYSFDLSEILKAPKVLRKICCFLGFFLAFCIYLISGLSLSQSVSSNHSSPASQISPSPLWPEIGFASKQRLNDHYQKHGKEFGAISREEYLRLAQELRDRPLEENILEAKRPDGVVSRFDRKGGAFLAFNRDGVIRTFFRPNDGEAYFWRQARRLPKR